MTTPLEHTPLARAFEDERYAWTRTVRLRRRMVLAEATLFTALVAATVLAAVTGGWSTWFFGVWTAGMLGFIPIHSLLNVGIRGVFDRSGRSLDEHQRSLRARSQSAMSWPSGLMTLLACTCGIAIVATTDDVALGLCLAFLLWMAAGLLAYWHLAWTLEEEDTA